MKVSIIIPVYNVEKYLPECLDSVLDQGWQLGEDYEVICVNDGSTDGSLAVLQRYEDKGIRVIDKPNCGVSSARNRGLDEARGEYVWMVDSDDFISPQMLPKVYEEASGKKLDVLFPRVAMTSEITPPENIY